MKEDKNNLILALYNVGVIKFGKFKLKSGKISPIYIDLRILVSYPKVLKDIAKEYLKLLKDLKFDTSNFLPYMFVKKVSKKLDIMMQKKEDIAKQLSRDLQKIFKTFTLEAEHLFKTLEKIQSWVELAQQEYEKALQEIENITTRKEAREKLSQIRNLVKANKLTWKDFLKFVKLIEDHFKQIDKLVAEIKNIKKKNW